MASALFSRSSRLSYFRALLLLVYFLLHGVALTAHAFVVPDLAQRTYRGRVQQSPRKEMGWKCHKALTLRTLHPPWPRRGGPARQAFLRFGAALASNTATNTRDYEGRREVNRGIRDSSIMTFLSRFFSPPTALLVP